jgi:hypothetical protein
MSEIHTLCRTRVVSKLLNGTSVVCSFNEASQVDIHSSVDVFEFKTMYTPRKTIQCQKYTLYAELEEHSNF